MRPTVLVAAAGGSPRAAVDEARVADAARIEAARITAANPTILVAQKGAGSATSGAPEDLFRHAKMEAARRACAAGLPPAMAEAITSNKSAAEAGSMGGYRRSTCPAPATAPAPAPAPPPPPVEVPHPYECTLCGFSCPTSQGLACHKRSASHIERSQSLA